MNFLGVRNEGIYRPSLGETVDHLGHRTGFVESAAHRRNHGELLGTSTCVTAMKTRTTEPIRRGGPRPTTRGCRARNRSCSLVTRERFPGRGVATSPGVSDAFGQLRN